MKIRACRHERLKLEVQIKVERNIKSRKKMEESKKKIILEVKEEEI